MASNFGDKWDAREKQRTEEAERMRRFLAGKGLPVAPPQPRDPSKQPDPPHPFNPPNLEAIKVAMVKADLISMGFAQMVAYMIARGDLKGLDDLAIDLKAFIQGKEKEEDGFQR